MEMHFRDITRIDPEARAVAEALDRGIADALKLWGIKKNVNIDSLSRGVIEKAIQYAINCRLERLMKEGGQA
jgi:hypothetical protein